MFCKDNKIVYHEINYKSHKGGPSSYFYVRKHKEDFVPLCRRCHTMIYVLYENFGIKLKDFQKIIEQRKINYGDRN